jgi:anti-anti-sigma regulatory factor
MTTISNPISAMSVTTGEVTELVRGSEQGLLARLLPLVRGQDVRLDMSRVRRIDAAGISALTALYVRARDAGHGFMVENPTARVEKVLALVGLEGVLVSHIANTKSHTGPRILQPVA